MTRLCVFAGTSEGRRLVELLAGRGAEIIACVATDYGEALLGEHPGVQIRAGRMDAREMSAFLEEGRFDLVVDATHPYAARVTENIFAACGALELSCLRLLRPGGASDEDGAFVPDAEACARFLLDTEGEILLTTGSKDLPSFCARPELRARIHARVLPMAASLEICERCGLRPDRILAMQGPFDEEMNFAMLRATRARWLVTKDAGDAGGYAAKLSAARRANARVVVIGRPPQRDGLPLEDVLREIESRFPLAPLRKRVTLAGIGMGDPGSQTLALRRAVEEADCLIGAQRMLEAVGCKLPPNAKALSGEGTEARNFGSNERSPQVPEQAQATVAPSSQPGLSAADASLHTAAGDKPCFEAVAAADIARIVREQPYARFAVLLSGDTGFYSGARKLIDALRDAELTVLPGIGSLQYLCAKLRRPWEDVRAVSLHGRDCDLAREVREHAAVFALVGGEGGARQALERLRDAGLGDCPAHVGERLGYPDEHIRNGRVSELAQSEFDPLSVLLVENAQAGGGWTERQQDSTAIATPGLPDEAFERGDVPMTKSEVRAVSLSKLMLTHDAVVYDVGTGSGSVAVEAARIARAGRVYAVERREAALELARRNAARFGLDNVTFVPGSAPGALEALPAPSHVFIGGSGGNLGEIVDCVLRKNPRARIVVNAVTLETVAELTELSRRFEFRDIAQLAVSKPRQIGGCSLMSAQNPVFIFTLQNPGAA